MFRSFLCALTALLGVLVAGEAAAQATTYTFTGGLYTGINPAPACVVGDCAPYTTAQRVVITLTFAAPLAPNLPVADRSAGVIAYTMNDGVRTTSGPGPNAAIFTALFGTDAAGLPSSYTLLLERTPGPPYTVNLPADPNSRFSYSQVTPTASSSKGNSVCASRAPGGAVAGGPGVCNSDPADPGTSAANSAQPTVVTSAPAGGATAVPTLSEWAMILLGLMLAGGAALHIHRRTLTA